MRDPTRKPCNLYANKLSRLLNQSDTAQCRSASKSQVQLVHTLSIYGQINVPICELNRLYGIQSSLKESKTAKRVPPNLSGLDDSEELSRFRRRHNSTAVTTVNRKNLIGLAGLAS